MAEAVIENQFFDFGVVCAHCGELGKFADLPPGKPLPAFKTVMLNHGQYRLTATIDTREDVVVAGEDAINRRAREVGQRDTSATSELSEALLRTMAVDARALLGDAYEKLAAAHARGKQSKTPPKTVHRLLELIDAAEAAADSFAADAPEIDADAIAELHSALGVFDRWKNDPCWSSIRASIATPSEFLHSVVLLVATSYLTDAGNGVELVRATGERRLPDLRIYTDAQTFVNTELKTPGALNRPERPLTIDEARQIVEAQISSAGTGPGKQLDPEHPGLLIIGGFGLRAADRTVLKAAARQELQRRPRQHILGIAIVSVGALLQSDPSGELELSGGATTDIVPNLTFGGPISVSTEARPGLELLSDFDQLAAQSAGPQLGRNDPCWCGSGRKFKKCHGA